MLLQRAAPLVGPVSPPPRGRKGWDSGLSPGRRCFAVRHGTHSAQQTLRAERTHVLLLPLELQEPRPRPLWELKGLWLEKIWEKACWVGAGLPAALHPRSDKRRRLSRAEGEQGVGQV